MGNEPLTDKLKNLTPEQIEEMAQAIADDMEKWYQIYS